MHAQSGQISGITLQNISGYARVQPNTAVYLCAYNSGLVCTTPSGEGNMYSDSALTQLISQSLLSDGNGHYNYFINSGIEFLEKDCFTTYVCQTYPVFISSSSSSGGTGTVVSFSSGNLSPLFTTSVATGSTTPTQSFVLDNAANNTFFGNFSGGTANPSYYTLVAGSNITITPSGSTVNIAAPGNGVLIADRFPGSTVDARIAAAFASVAGTSGSPTVSAEVDLTPGQTYTIPSSIIVPGNTVAPFIDYVVLDCKGSTINVSSGSVIPIIVNPEEGSGPWNSGALRNCKINGAASDGTEPVVQANSRLGFLYENLSLFGGSSCLDFENTTNQGGVGFTEQTSIHGLTTLGCSSHVMLHDGTGATGSFEHNWWNGGWHCVVGPNEKCFDAGQAGTTPFDTQDTRVDVNVNSINGGSGSTAYVVWVDNGNNVFRGIWHIGGENTSSFTNLYSAYINSASSTFYNEGSSLVTSASGVGFAANVPHTNYVIHPGLSTVSNDAGSSTPIHYEPENGVFFQRHCKFDIGGSSNTPSPSTVFWLARYGGTEDDCSFQILSRSTSNTAGDGDVDIKGSAGSPEQNDFYVDALTGFVGIGPGFGNGIPTGATVPTTQLDVSGNALVTGNIASNSQISAPTIIANSGSTAISLFVQSSNTNLDGIALQNSTANWWTLGSVGSAGDGTAPAGSFIIQNETSTGIDFTVQDSGVSTPGSVSAASFSIGGTAGFSGTKTAGSCVLTIAGGIITNVTGC